MVRLFSSSLTILALCFVATGAAVEPALAEILTGKMKGIDGKDVDLSQYHGKVVLVVNVASKCGYTPQYEGLQAIYEKYKEQGFVVLGVPCNQFGNQEPGDESQIQQFCSSKYNVTFPLLAKVDVNGTNASPLYKALKSKSPTPGEIKWNFEKFLIGKSGQVAGRYNSKVKPTSDELTKAIEVELKK